MRVFCNFFAGTLGIIAALFVIAYGVSLYTRNEQNSATENWNQKVLALETEKKRKFALSKQCQEKATREYKGEVPEEVIIACRRAAYSD